MESFIGTKLTMLEDSAVLSTRLAVPPRTSGERNEPTAGKSSSKTDRSPEASAFLNTGDLFTPFVTASIEEIGYARELRRQIVQTYLSQPTPRVSPWCVGVD